MATRPWTCPKCLIRITTKTHRCVYLPPPEEIRRLCLEIQDGWTEVEKERRMGAFRPVPAGIHYQKRRN